MFFCVSGQSGTAQQGEARGGSGQQGAAGVEWSREWAVSDVNKTRKVQGLGLGCKAKTKDFGIKAISQQSIGL